MDNNQKYDPKDESLETSETVSQQPSVTPLSAGGDSLETDKINATGSAGEEITHVKTKKSLAQRVQGLVGRFNIYLLLFILIILLAGIATFASFRASKNAVNQSNINSQSLSASDLSNLKSNDTTVGDAKQTLTIASNSIFNGRVLVRDNLDVAGTVRIGGTLSLPGITVSGTSAFENVQIGNNLSVAGNGAIQGTLTVQKNLSVGGSGSFAGNISAPSISVDKLILNQNLQIIRHIETGGSTPGIASVNPGAVMSINGSDTAGTVSVAFSYSTNGNLARVTFTNRFNQIPHIVITPMGRGCGNLNSYIDDVSVASFVIGIDGSSSAGGRCSFSYIVIE